MLFNSYIFILFFMPLTVAAYFLFNRFHITAGKLVLAVSSLIFYLAFDSKMAVFLCISLLFNYAFAVLCGKKPCKKIYLIIPTVINAGLLIYFKYTNFLISNINLLAGTEIPLQQILLPVGISFITFQQIAYLVCAAKGELPSRKLMDYIVFILYFPKLLMGPLADPADFIMQLNDKGRKRLQWDHVAEGLKIFSFGLFKKVILADTFARAVSYGFDNIDALTSMDVGLVMLFYTFQIYFDFSGYSDMAVGVSHILNITLPMNFNSPYQAISPRDFWKRWHMSLTGFLTRYIYIPLGGSRRGVFFTYLNTMIVFLVSGIWHGANWTFILWGILHGLLCILDRVFEKRSQKIIQPVRWGFTFLAVNILWLLFASQSVEQWLRLLGILFGFQNTAVSAGLLNCFSTSANWYVLELLHLNGLAANVRGLLLLIFTLAGGGICLMAQNNYTTLQKKSPVSMVTAAVAMAFSLLNLSAVSVFVYFNF